MSDDELEELWRSFDLSKEMGLRDYAEARRMADLGMRVSDMA